jgi:hypothetical protein
VTNEKQQESNLWTNHSLGFLGRGEDDAVVFGLEPLHGVLLGEAVGEAHGPRLPPPTQ